MTFKKARKTNKKTSPKQVYDRQQQKPNSKRNEETIAILQSMKKEVQKVLARR